MGPKHSQETISHGHCINMTETGSIHFFEELTLCLGPGDCWLQLTVLWYTPFFPSPALPCQH